MARNFKNITATVLEDDHKEVCDYLKEEGLSFSHFLRVKEANYILAKKQIAKKKEINQLIQDGRS